MALAPTEMSPESNVSLDMDRGDYISLDSSSDEELIPPRNRKQYA
jgi:hypothetical protein